MKCPKCDCEKHNIIDSRPTNTNLIRRRRECIECKKRFTTYEMPSNILTDYNRFLKLGKSKKQQLIDQIKSFLEDLEEDKNDNEL